jgi:hypothetical protein
VSEALFDSVVRIARHEASARPMAAIGVVVDVFDGSALPPNHAVSVKLRDTGLVLPGVPVAVGVLGYAATPAPGDLVIVVFADGDFHAPVVMGRLYHADLSPPGHVSGEIVLRLPAGATSPSCEVVIRGSDPAVEIHLGRDVVIEATDGRIRLAAGQAEATLETGGGGRAELKVGQAVLTMTGRGDVELKTQGKLALEGADVTVKGIASVGLAAPQVKLG